MGKTLPDQYGIEAFQVGQDHELFQRCVVAKIAIGGGIGLAPLPGGLAEEGDIKRSASLAYTAFACALVTSGGMRVSFMASVWMR